MRTIHKALLALFLLAPFAAQADPTFFWRCEGTTLDGTDDFTAGDTTAASSGTPAIDSNAERVGTNGCLTNGVESFRFDTASITNPAEASIGLSVRFVSAIQNGGKVFRLRGANDNDTIEILVVNSDELRLNIRNATGGLITLDTTAANITADNYFGVVIRYHCANDDRSISVYNSSDVLIQTVSDTSTDLSANCPADLTQSDGIRLGDTAGANTIHYDNLIIATTYAEPVEDNLSITSYTAYDDGSPDGPVFTSGPAAGTPTSTTIPTTFTSDTDGTVFGVACPDGDMGTAAQALAGNCTGDVAAAAVFTEGVVATVADGETFIGLTAATTYDLGFVIDGASADSTLATVADIATDAAPSLEDSEIATFTNEDRSPGTGQAILALTSISTTSIFGLNTDYFDPDVAVGDVIEYQLVANENADCAVSFEADGDFVLTPTVAGDCDGRISFAISYQDVSNATSGLFTAPASVGNFSADDTIFVNDPDIECDNAAPFEILLVQSVAMDPVTVPCTHSIDTLTYAVTTGSLNAGLSLDDETGIISGTPTAEDEAGNAFTITATNAAGQTAAVDFVVSVVGTFTVPNCVGNTLNECIDEILAVAPWRDTDVGLDVGAMTCDPGTPNLIVSQDPAASAEAEPFEPIVVSLSRLCGSGGRPKLQLQLRLE